MAHQQPGVFDLQCSLLDRRLQGLTQPLQDEIGVVMHLLEHILSGDNEVGRRFASLIVTSNWCRDRIARFLCLRILSG